MKQSCSDLVIGIMLPTSGRFRDDSGTYKISTTQKSEFVKYLKTTFSPHRRRLNAHNLRYQKQDRFWIGWFMGRDRLRLTALTTNHHGGGAKRRICTFVVYGETMQRQHKWSRTDIVVHTVQLMWGIIWNLATELLCIKAVKISAGSS